MKQKVEFKIERMHPQKTVVLMWNPSISSYTMERFEDDLRDMTDGWAPEDFNWSVWRKL